MDEKKRAKTPVKEQAKSNRELEHFLRQFVIYVTDDEARKFQSASQSRKEDKHQLRVVEAEIAEGLIVRGRSAADRARKANGLPSISYIAWLSQGPRDKYYRLEIWPQLLAFPPEIGGIWLDITTQTFFIKQGYEYYEVVHSFFYDLVRDNCIYFLVMDQQGQPTLNQLITPIEFLTTFGQELGYLADADLGRVTAPPMSSSGTTSTSPNRLSPLSRLVSPITQFFGFSFPLSPRAPLSPPTAPPQTPQLLMTPIKEFKPRSRDLRSVSLDSGTSPTTPLRNPASPISLTTPLRNPTSPISLTTPLRNPTSPISPTTPLRSPTRLTKPTTLFRLSSSSSNPAFRSLFPVPESTTTKSEADSKGDERDVAKVAGIIKRCMRLHHQDMAEQLLEQAERRIRRGWSVDKVLLDCGRQCVVNGLDDSNKTFGTVSLQCGIQFLQPIAQTNKDPTNSHARAKAAYMMARAYLCLKKLYKDSDKGKAAEYSQLAIEYFQLAALCGSVKAEEILTQPIDEVREDSEISQVSSSISQ